MSKVPKRRLPELCRQFFGFSGTQKMQKSLEKKRENVTCEHHDHRLVFEPKSGGNSDISRSLRGARALGAMASTVRRTFHARLASGSGNATELLVKDFWFKKKGSHQCKEPQIYKNWKWKTSKKKTKKFFKDFPFFCFYFEFFGQICSSNEFKHFSETDNQKKSRTGLGCSSMSWTFSGLCAAATGTVRTSNPAICRTNSSGTFWLSWEPTASGVTERRSSDTFTNTTSPWSSWKMENF